MPNPLLKKYLPFRAKFWLTDMQDLWLNRHYVVVKGEVLSAVQVQFSLKHTFMGFTRLNDAHIMDPNSQRLTPICLVELPDTQKVCLAMGHTGIYFVPMETILALAADLSIQLAKLRALQTSFCNPSSHSLPRYSGQW